MTDAFERFSPRTERVLAFSEDEARRLGHGQVGTEHLVLGILVDGDSRAARALVASGATLGGCRSKVSESVVANPRITDGPLPLTERANRALERAERLSLRRREPKVEPEHVLVSVLDVEGRAGQVLRSLTVDLLRLREAVDAESAPVAEPQPKAKRPPGPRCPTCRAGLAGGLAHQVVRSHDPDGGGDRDLVVAYCPGCGSVIPVVDRS